MLQIKQFVFSMFGVNTYLLIDQDTLEAAVIDPAMSEPSEYKRFSDYLQESKATLTQIINTHLHLDHCFGLNYVKAMYGVPAKAHVDDEFLASMMGEQYRKFGLDPNGAKFTLDVRLQEGDVIDIGKSQLQVIHVPGHTPGGIALYYQEGGVLFSGDSLFHRSIGRTDLNGDLHQLLDSIKSKLYALPDDTLVLPGHSESTTIGEEKRYNPFTR